MQCITPPTRKFSNSAVWGIASFTSKTRCNTTPTSLTRTRALRSLKQVETLPSWEQQSFEEAYGRGIPARLTSSKAHLPPACSKWFIHDHDTDVQAEHYGQIQAPSSSELRLSFWRDYGDIFVPLEMTTTSTHAGDLMAESLDANHETTARTTFERIEAPLKVLLDNLSPNNAPSATPVNQAAISIYLAQCDLPSLPSSLTVDVPIPRLIHRSTQSSSSPIRGDIYASSLWLGRAPTYTPLHRDPNPNLFIQLAETKIVRLLPPDIGEALYHELLAKLPGSGNNQSSRIRGEEMMQSPQREVFHDAVWDEGSEYAERVMVKHCVETTLGMGDALFTPLGWWHSVKGVGMGITASVNWWFR
jgi:hypothetical protein